MENNKGRTIESVGIKRATEIRNAAVYIRVLGVAIRYVLDCIRRSEDSNNLLTDVKAALTVEKKEDGEISSDKEISLDVIRHVSRCRDASNSPSQFNIHLQEIFTDTENPSEIAQLTRRIHVLCDYIESSKFYYPNLYFVDELTQSQRLAQMEEWHSEILDLRTKLSI